MMKSRQVVVGAAVVLAQLTLANSANADKWYHGIYAGAGGGTSYLSPLMTGSPFRIVDEESEASHIFLGKSFSRRLSAEFQFADLGKVDLSPPGFVDYSVNSVSGLLYLWNRRGADKMLKRLGLSAFGRAGFGKMENDSSAPYTQLNDVHLLLGGGIEYGWSNGFGARAEVVSYDTDARYASLSLLYKLGAKESEPVLSAMRPDSDLIAVTGPILSDPGEAPVDLPVVYFGVNSADLTMDAQEKLSALALRMDLEEQLQIIIVGHTDKRGSADYNKNLGGARVMAVARFLTQSGIPVDRMQAFSKGEQDARPTTRRRGSASRSNRRVEILAAPPPQQ